MVSIEVDYPFFVLAVVYLCDLDVLLFGRLVEQYDGERIADVQIWFDPNPELKLSVPIRPDVVAIGER